MRSYSTQQGREAKKAVSFWADIRLARQFKMITEHKGETMESLLNGFVADYVKNNQGALKAAAEDLASLAS